MSWLVHANAALVVAAKLAVELRPDAPALDVARGQCELLLQHLDALAALGAVVVSKASDPPVQSLKGDNGASWEDDSFRWSPPETV